MGGSERRGPEEEGEALEGQAGQQAVGSRVASYALPEVRSLDGRRESGGGKRSAQQVADALPRHLPVSLKRRSADPISKCKICDLFPES